MISFSSAMSSEASEGTRRRISLAGSILILLFAGVGLNSLSPSLKLASSGALALLILIWFTGYRRRLPRPLVALAAPLGGLLAVQTISLLWTPLPRTAVELLLQNILLLAFAMLVASSVLSGWPARSWLEAVLLIAGALCLIELLLVQSWLLDWIAVGSEFSLLPPVGYRASGLLLGHPNVLSGFINLAVPLVIYQLVRSSSMVNRIGLALYIGVLLTTQYFTSSRTGWIALAASLFVMAALYALSEGTRDESPLHRAVGRVSDWHAAHWALVAAAVAAGGYALFWQISRTGHAPISRARLPVWEASFNLLRQSPFLGSGLGSFPPLFAAQELMFDEESVPHAHNLLLQLNIDSGWPGVALATVFLVLMTAHGLRRWNSSASADRRMIATFAALAAGVLTHHLADYLFGPPLYTMAVACLAGVFAATAVSTTDPSKMSGLWLGPWIGGVSLVAVGGIAWSLTGSWTHWDASLAARESDWEIAEAEACASYASHPRQAAYAASCGVAAELSGFYSGDGSPRPEAFASAAMADPNWYLHWANLGVESRERGNYSRAASALDQAIQRAPHAAELLLNRGYVEELQDNRAAAASYYRRAARLDPWITTSAFIQSNELRQGAVLGLRLAGYQEGGGALLWRAQEKLQAGELKAATDLVERTIRINPRVARAYALRAQIHLRSGELNQAFQYAAIAEFIHPKDPWVMEAGIEVLRARGNVEGARTRLMEAIDSLLHQSSSERYFFAAYRRYSFQVDRHPGFIRADVPAPLAAVTAEMLERGELTDIQASAARMLLRQCGLGMGLELP